MATLSSGDTLSLNNLATATDQSTKSMGTVAGSTATPISMSAFAIDSVGAVTGFTYVVELLIPNAIKIIMCKMQKYTLRNFLQEDSPHLF